MAGGRSLSNLLGTVTLAKVCEVQFVDDTEMAEILTDERLVQRLRAGSRQARGRKGRFVPLSTASSRS